MILVTERLCLRPWQESDAEACYELAKDPRVGPIAGWPAHKSVEESLTIIREELIALDVFAICCRRTGELLGSVGFHYDDLATSDDEAELGYWLGSAYWGRGIAVEASEEMLRHAFLDLRLNRVWCGSYDGNERSRRVQEKLGFKYQWTTNEIFVERMGETRSGQVRLITRDEWLDMHAR